MAGVNISLQMEDVLLGKYQRLSMKLLYLTGISIFNYTFHLEEVCTSLSLNEGFSRMKQ